MSYGQLWHVSRMFQRATGGFKVFPVSVLSSKSISAKPDRLKCFVNQDSTLEQEVLLCARRKVRRGQLSTWCCLCSKPFTLTDPQPAKLSVCQTVS